MTKTLLPHEDPEARYADYVRWRQDPEIWKRCICISNNQTEIDEFARRYHAEQLASANTTPPLDPKVL